MDTVPTPETRASGVATRSSRILSMADTLCRAVADRIASALVLKRVTLKGNAMTDDFGPSIIVHSAQLSPVDVKAEARKLYEEVEGSL